MSRSNDFMRIKEKFSNPLYASDFSFVINGDSLSEIKKMPDHSISLILTDPPYHSTKKSNIINDKAFKEDEDFLNWISKYIVEWKRVLRPNGSIFFFCSSAMLARLEIIFSEHFNVLSNIVWTKPNLPGFDGWKQKMNKEALRQWYAHSERIIFATPAMNGNLKRSYFGNFLKEKRLQSGLSGHQLTELTGAYGKVNHGGAVSNWETGRNIPSREQYSKICIALLSTGNVSSMPEYEDIIRPFSVNSDVEFTDVWNFPSVKPYKGKHPAEKPIDMLEHAINATTYEGDIVLDCFSGSGNTALAAINLNRRNISIEISEEWAIQISRKIFKHESSFRELNLEKIIEADKELSLFSHIV